VGYQYDLEDNKYILDAIHEQYLYFYSFPLVGTQLIDSELTISERDYLAYFALYPQNGKLVNGQPEAVSAQESKVVLQVIVESLQESNAAEKYTSNTTELTYLPEFRSDNSAAGETKQNIANLIAIAPGYSKEYRNNLRRSLGLPEVQYAEGQGLEQLELEPEIAVYISSDSNVDLYDWTQNGLPGGDGDKVYYNPIDRNYYYVKRTEIVDNSGFSFANWLRSRVKKESVESAIGVWRRLEESDKERYTSSVENAVREILKLTERNSEQNFNLLKRNFVPPDSYNNVDRREKSVDCFPLLTHKGPRPGSRWMYCLKIPSEQIAQLNEVVDSTAPSQRETDLTALEKAKKLISNSNKSTQSITFSIQDMLRYLLSVRQTLRKVSFSLDKQGISSESIKGVNLEQEASKLENFFELFGLFANHNRFSLEDTDEVEIFFTSKFEVDHIVVNGLFYSSGYGTNPYLNPDNNVIVNAFSLFTPTTFSILSNAQRIYKDASDNSPIIDDPVRFVKKYIYPTPELSPSQVKRLNSRQSSSLINKRRNTLFTKLSEISSVSPQEYEKLFSGRKQKFRISTAISTMDCNTAQAQFAKYALKFYQAITGKTKMTSLIRETILILKQEVIEDEITKRILTDADLYYRNPDLVYADIEKFVNEQIFCSLDVLGDFIEDNFLDPLGDPPEAKYLTSKTINQFTPTVELKKTKMVSLKVKQSDIYRKAVETIIENFIKSLIAGVVKDIVNALFGCGPKSKVKNSNSDLSNRLTSLSFGSANLQDLIGFVDLVRIAKMTPLYNVSTETSEDGQTITTKRIPTLQQLTSLIDDVSKMCTPVELQQLLDGDADYDLIQHILETVSGQSSIPNFNIDPQQYNTIDFTADNITDFFYMLGESLDFGETAVIKSSPLSVYCSNLNSEDDIIRNLGYKDIEIEALAEQYQQSVSAKLDKINFLCDFLRGFQGMELRIQQMINLIPDLQWYDDFLRFIASASNSITEFFTKSLLDMFDKTENKFVRSKGEYNLYSSKLGSELFYKIFLSLRELLINQVYSYENRIGYLTPSSWSPGRGRFRVRTDRQGRVSFEGNFASRNNEQLDRSVYNFIWEDLRARFDESEEWRRNSDPGDIPPPGTIGRIINTYRLDVPQFLEKPQKQYESFDAAYYSIRTSPPPLEEKIKRFLTRERMQNLGATLDGENNVRTRGDRELLTLISKEVRKYLLSMELESPYVGWTGASYLTFGNPSIDISFFERPTTDSLKTVCTYTPTEFNCNEVSDDIYKPGTKGTFGQINYQIFKGLETSDYNIRLDRNNNFEFLNVDGAMMPPVGSPAFRTYYNRLSIGKGPFSDNNRYRRTSEATFFQNYTRRIDTQINDAVIAKDGPQNMSRYIQSISRFPFTQLDDECITAQDISKASVAVETIQNHMFHFFLNIMPMTTVYPNWGSVGTVKLISDYLFQKISQELAYDNMLGPFESQIGIIQKVFPRISSDEDMVNNPLISDTNSPGENLKNIIEAMYISMLSNIAKNQVFSEINKSIFNQDTMVDYKRVLLELYRTLANPRTDLREYGIIDANMAEQTKQKVREFYTENDITELGMLVSPYFVPGAPQIASYMIYHDKGIKFSERYKDTFLRYLSTVADSYDGLLTSIKGQSVFQFSEALRNFPAYVSTWDTNTAIEYFRNREVRTRLNSIESQYISFNETLEGYGIFSMFDLQDITIANDGIISYLDSLADLSVVEGDPFDPNERIRGDVKRFAREEIDTIFRNWSSPDNQRRELNEIEAQRAALIQSRIAQLRQQLIVANEQQAAAINEEINSAQASLQGIGLKPFNFNRTIETSRQRLESEQITDLERRAEELWIIILENNWLDIELEPLTPQSYYDTISEYFRLWASYTQQRFEEEERIYREENPNQGGLPPRLDGLELAGKYIAYLADVYEFAPTLSPLILEEKTSLENLLITND
jgi:hypothetical protein